MSAVAPSTPAPRRPPVRSRQVSLHGHLINYLEAGRRGPVLLLIHGIAGRAAQWRPVMQLLGHRFRVIAPDLLGHGASAKPRGDYSLGAYAVTQRDFLIALGVERATVVGHSFGGGVAMQLAYQFPTFCERLVLIGSGGLGKEVNLLLRLATLPGSEWVLPLIAHERVIAKGAALSARLGRAGINLGGDLAEIARSYASLADRETRTAFIHTARGVMDFDGQRVSALDRLYLAEDIPTLLIWGARDPVIPAKHGRAAQEAMPSSRLEVMADAGHFPQLDQPAVLAGLLAGFIEDTEPARLDDSPATLKRLRRRLIARGRSGSGGGRVRARTGG